MSRSLVIVLAILISPRAMATIRHVPADHPTIQSAILVCVDGDTVLVAPGTYQENIDFLGKDIIVTSSGGANITTIDGGGSGSVVTFDTGETSLATLSGFTIRGGEGTIVGLSSYGGGIYCRGASPTIHDNRIINNHVGPGAISGLGGGIYCQDSSATIRDNVVSGNSAATDGGGINIGPGNALVASNTIMNNQANNTGGGVLCWGNILFPCNAVIQQNLIESNTGGSGGGVSFTLGATPSAIGNQIRLNESWTEGGGISLKGDSLVEANTIERNTALGYGGGVACLGGSPTITRNDIAQNQTESSFGGGMYLSDCSPTLSNNFIRSNNAVIGFGRGGGVYATNSSVSMINNTVFHNISWSSGGGVAFLSSALLIENTIIYGNSSLNTNTHQIESGATITFSDIQGGYPGTGNIDAYPEFVNPAPNSEDLHLLINSPCLNAGNSGASGLPTSDIDGDARIVHGGVDMGADEYSGCLILMTAFGDNISGSGGFAPTLSGSGLNCDAGGHAIHIRDGLGSTLGHLWVGLGTAPLPFLGGTLYVDLTSQWTLIPIRLAGGAGVPGAGFLDIPGANLNPFGGLTFYLQVSLIDPGAPRGATLTNALELLVSDS